MRAIFLPLLAFIQCLPIYGVASNIIIYTLWHHLFNLICDIFRQNCFYKMKNYFLPILVAPNCNYWYADTNPDILDLLGQYNKRHRLGPPEC